MKNPCILGPCTQQTISGPFKACWALVLCSLSCDLKYPVFFTSKTTAALYTFSPGLPQNEGVFPGKQFVALPNRPERSAQCYSQRGLLRCSMLRKCPGTVLFGVDISDGELMPRGKFQSGTDTTSRAGQLLFPSPPTTDAAACIKTGEVVSSGMGQEAVNWKPEAQPLLLTPTTLLYLPKLVATSLHSLSFLPQSCLVCTGHKLFKPWAASPYMYASNLMQWVAWLKYFK